MSTIVKSFDANAFNLQSFGGALSVEPWTGGETTIEITLSGPAERVSAIKMWTRGGAAFIEDPKAREGGGSGGTTITVNGGSVTIRANGNSTVSNVHVGRMTVSGQGNVGVHMAGGVVTVNGVLVDTSAAAGKEADPPLSVIVRVPLGAAVEIANLYSDGKIGDTFGPVSAAMVGDSDLTVGRITEGSFSIKGSGDIDVREVSGSLTAQILGSGDISVRSGNVEHMMANVMGSGDVTFRGTAKSANLTLMGSGDITVARVMGRVVKSHMGSGDITVN
jgi:hypothetical protein